MSCSVAIAGSSPAFSPSRIPIYSSEGSPSSASCSSSSPFRRRFQRPASGALRSLEQEICALPEESLKRSSGLLLKRKRPARLDIPVAVAALGLADLERSEKGSEMEEEGERFSVFCKRGRKSIVMEDRYKAETHFRGDPQMAFFGIFDGHGGTKAAEFAAENLCRRVEEEIREEGFMNEGGSLEEAVRIGYLRTDEEFSKEEIGGGACCVTAVLGGGVLVVSNAGDCRAVLSRSGVAEALTSDHRPSREDERLRIESLGGFVECRRGVWRLQGSLAVSRGIGDEHLKPFVAAEPETTTVRVEPDYEFLVMASDGLWDKVANQEAVDLARPLIIAAGPSSPGRRETPAEAMSAACKELAQLASSRGSFDDISVMIVLLSSSS